MTNDETHNRYQRFLTEIERIFADESIGRSQAEQEVMLQLTRRMIDSFVHLYGDGGTSSTLLNEVRRILAENNLSFN